MHFRVMGDRKEGVTANEGSRSEEGGTKRIVYAALVANLLIAAAKCVTH